MAEKNIHKTLREKLKYTSHCDFAGLVQNKEELLAIQDVCVSAHTLFYKEKKKS